MAAVLSADRAAAEAFLLGRINYERDGVPYRERSFGLGRMQALVARLGDPHLAAPAVHIAGTKGKGSTSSMLAAILAAAGYRTGLYTSPHFERIEERMSVGGEICPPKEFAELALRIKPHVETLDAEGPGEGPTYFDITTAIAFLYFARHEVEVMVLEVGLGGRLDSTNVCRPAATAITSISFDHTKQLGPTLDSIAREKAGILKPGVPAVCGVLAAEPREAIHAVAAEVGAPVCQLGRDFDFAYDPAGSSVSYREGAARLDGLSLGLIGRHQAANAAVAVATCRRLAEAGWRIGEAELRAGLAQARCPGRVEVLRRQPTVILDTAHNHASIDALLDTLDESFPSRRRTILFACSRDKDYRAMLALLLPRCDRLILTRFANSSRGVELESLVAAANDARRELVERHASGSLARIEACESSLAAWRFAADNSDPADLICITGSFFLAAELRPVVLS